MGNLRHQLVTNKPAPVPYSVIFHSWRGSPEFIWCMNKKEIHQKLNAHHTC